MEMNRAIITGTIVKDSYSHYAHDADFRKMTIASRRNSGAMDIVHVVYRDDEKEFKENEHVKAIGSLRSRRQNKRLELYIYAEEIEAYEGEEINEIMIEGHTCSEPYYKEMPGRKLTQVMLCSEGKRKAYASVLIWKKTNIKVGQRIIICGRIQSRTYKDGEHDRCINEISAYRAEDIRQKIRQIMQKSDICQELPKVAKSCQR